MENTKVWAPVIVLGLFLAGFFVYTYFEKVDKANVEFQNAKLITAQAQDSLTGRQQMLEYRQKLAVQNQAALKRVQNAEARVKTAEELQANADKKQRLIEGDLKYWLVAMPTAIQKTREAAIGTEFPELTLQSGKVLKSAKIRKVEEGSVSIIHAEGVGSIDAAELLPELQKKLDLGQAPLLMRLKQVQDSLADKTIVADQPPQAASPAPQTQSGSKSVEDAKLKALKYRESDLQTKLNAAQLNMRNWQAHLQSISTQISSNQARGVPTSKLRDDYQSASAQAAAAQAGIVMIEGDLKKIQVEIDLLNKRIQ